MGGVCKMKEMSLEFEFKIYKMIHKTTILQAKMTNHFTQGVQTGYIPFQKTPHAEIT